MSKFEEDFHIQHFKDEPLQVRIMDYDTYSANDAIGKVCQCDNVLIDILELRCTLTSTLCCYHNQDPDQFRGLTCQYHLLSRLVPADPVWWLKSLLNRVVLSFPAGCLYMTPCKASEAKST